uniref:Si:ch211-1e14.1 n=1 Tax=Neogobius melanostomus TaxID=47308 RepID=A0A8C6T5G4_9GOBI
MNSQVLSTYHSTNTLFCVFSEGPPLNSTNFMINETTGSLQSITNPTARKTTPSQPPWSNATLPHEPSPQNVATVSSFPRHSLEPSKVAFSDYQADHVIPNPNTETSSNSLDITHISPSKSPPFINPPLLVAPGYNVVSPHPTSPIYEPMESPPDDIFPTDSLDIDWGSGDYLETMSYMGSDGVDYSLVTKVPTEMFDMDEDTESYDTSFPTRVGLSLTSMQHFLHSPSLTTAHFPSHFAIEPTPSIALHTDIAESANSDWQDHFTIEPTDVLLPDMNSLEYYSTQQESSNSGAEQRGNVTVVGVTDLTPTISFDNITKDESSSDVSGMEPGFDFTDVTPTNASNNDLEPSKTAGHFVSKWNSEIVASTTSQIEVLNNATGSYATSTTETPPNTSIDNDDTTIPGTTEDGGDIPVTLTLSPENTEADTGFTTAATTVNTTPRQDTPKMTTATEMSKDVSVSNTIKPLTTTKPAREYLCDITQPEYLVKIGFPFGATIGYAKSQVRDILKAEFNKSVELQVFEAPPKFVFRVVSDQVVYTAISVINALQRSGRRFLSLSPSWASPDYKYQVHTVLQFVPSHVDVRFCNFTESIERGLTRAYAEVRRRLKESTNFTVHIVNVTNSPLKILGQLARHPVDIVFTVRGSKGHVMGSEVSNALLKLTMVEFSYYMGFPVLQIAEPFHYPELNTSQLLRSSWVKTVLLGVMDQKVNEKTFQANIERRFATLLGEAMGLMRRVKRATTVGNSSVQVVSSGRLTGSDHPLEIVYFAEGPDGERIPAVKTASLLNSLDVQRAAIVLGYRVQGILAQPVEKVASSPSENVNTNLWIIIGVVIPLLVVIIIISILYWKLCRTDKLEFQPDAMTSIQQRQKLQTPSVKGFDFAKLHLGQQSKDDVMVIQEPSGPAPLPMSIKDGLSPSENGEIPTPVSKGSSTKASYASRRRERISPSDGDSVVTDHSCDRESAEDNLRGPGTPSDAKHTRKIPINVLNGPPPMNGTAEQLSSASIFEHVDRMSRATDAGRRPNKVQLIAMQPMSVPPLHSPPANGKVSDPEQINREIQVALRQKSEIEHHRNKIRLRAKRKGHYDFPAMEDMTNGLCDSREQDHIYQKAQLQIDKILDPDAQTPAIFIEPKKSCRGRRSPKQRIKDPLNGGMMEADKDHLITDDCDAAYRKCPGVNNVAYVSDPDQGPGSPFRSPSPTDDVFLGPACSPPGHAPPPPPYMPPQPSIEEARQQMHSLLDDAFALVSPTSQGSSAGITLPGVNGNHSSSSPPGHWGSAYQPLGPFSTLSIPPSVTSVKQCVAFRQGLGSSYLPPGEPVGLSEQLQPDSLYISRGLYADELPSSARPRPVGGTAGKSVHHLTQVGLSSRMNGYPAGGRVALGQNGGIGWNPYHDTFTRAELEKDMARNGIREQSALPPHLDTSGVGYLSAPPPLDPAPPTHSSASLIKAIREELLRLSQKQAAVPSYHS